MGEELGRKITSIMTREMGQLGEFIITKQCKDLNIDKSNISGADKAKLADALSSVMITFGGPEKAKAIKDEIKRLEVV